MKVTLKSTNIENYPSIEKTILIIPRENEILISTEDGKEIAKLTVAIMDKDEFDPVNNGWKTVPSNSYFVTFHPVSAETHEASADVFLD